MISLEHIRQLQDRVTKAVEHLTSLQEENDLLRSRISGYETRIGELEKLVESFKSEQSEIEEGIMSALSHLENLENAVEVLRTPQEPVSAEASHEASQAALPSPQAVEQEPSPSMEVIQPEPELDYDGETAPSEEAVVDSYEEDQASPNEQQLEIF